MGAAGWEHWSELEGVRGTPERHECAEDQASRRVRTLSNGSNWAARTTSLGYPGQACPLPSSPDESSALLWGP